MRPDAMLIVGPTGSGKTPLGAVLEAYGLHGRRCVHFDFGVELRNAAAQDHVQGLSQADLAFVRRCLSEGALLEKETFHIAETLFARFVARRNVGPRDRLVLNGLPRHVGQARDVDRMAAVTMVVTLECDAQTVAARIASNAGGDRGGRTDDTPEDVARKLAIFVERTRPLIQHYRALGVPVVSLQVGAATTPEQMAAQLSRQQ